MLSFSYIYVCVTRCAFDWKRIRTHAGNLKRKRFVINKIAKQPTHIHTRNDGKKALKCAKKATTNGIRHQLAVWVDILTTHLITIDEC